MFFLTTNRSGDGMMVCRNWIQALVQEFYGFPLTFA